MPEISEAIKQHNVLLKSRGHMELDGVTDVVSFDEMSVCLETVLGEMIIEGENLRVSTLDTERGIIMLDGKINSLYYNTEVHKEKRGLFGRLHT